MRFGTGFGICHIFVTRFQQDHVLGIPGLLHTMDYSHRDSPLTIHVPSGTKSRVSNLTGIAGMRPSFPVHINEISPDSTVLNGEGYRIESFPTTCSESSVGYRITELDRRGRFKRKKAEHELGIPEGPLYSTLCNGNSVELEDGRVIQPEQVLGPPRPGRTIVYTGDTCPSDTIVEASENVDLLIHDAAFTESQKNRAAQTGHSTAAEAGEVASRAEAKRLALFHFAPRYESSTDHLQEAEEVVDSTTVIAPDDGFSIDIPYPEPPEQPDTESESPTQDEPVEPNKAVEAKQSTASTTPQQTADGGAVSTNEASIKRSTGDLSEAREQAESEAREEVEVTTNRTTQRSSEYSRSTAIKRYVKKRANGYCEGCEKPAPFTSKTGEPYLHAHHVFELSDGGSDTPDTVVALCPNCHFRVHHGKDGKEYNKKLYEKVQQLEEELSDL